MRTSQSVGDRKHSVAAQLQRVLPLGMAVMLLHALWPNPAPSTTAADGNAIIVVDTIANTSAATPMMAPPTSTPASFRCLGDCDNSGAVSVEDLLALVEVALGNSPISGCQRGNANGDDRITVDEILTAVATALNGCASPLHFIGFNGTEIVQVDDVGVVIAQVDVVRDLCVFGPLSISEPFTSTMINAVFRNDGAADLHLSRMVIDIGPQSGLEPIARDITADIPGGHCSDSAQPCASDDDCSTTCVHAETTVAGLLLFDFDDKAYVVPGTYDVSIQFFGSDANQNYITETHYRVFFGDFNNCI